MTPTSRSGWAALAGGLVAAVLAALVLWTLPSALAREDRSREAARLELELRRFEARTDAARAETEGVDQELSYSTRISEELRPKLAATQQKVERLQKRVRQRTKRIEALGG